MSEVANILLPLFSEKQEGRRTCSLLFLTTKKEFVVFFLLWTFSLFTLEFATEQGERWGHPNWVLVLKWRRNSNGSEVWETSDKENESKM